MKRKQDFDLKKKACSTRKMKLGVLIILQDEKTDISYGELVDIANAAIWQYRDMYLRPDFYKDNLEKVRVIISPVIEDYKSGRITYAEA